MLTNRLEMTETRFDCIGFGICAADYLCLLGHYPKLDEKTTASEFSKQGGGPVPTALVTLARLGARTAFIGKVGNDAAGDFIREEFRREGVSTAFMIIDEAVKTPEAFIWIDQPSGKRTVVLNRTHISDVSVGQIAAEQVTAGKILLIDGWEAETSIQAAKWAKDSGRIVVADFGSVRERIEEMLPLVDYPIVSAKFIRQMWGQIEVPTATKKLLQWGARAGVVTCGPQGCFGNDGQHVYFQPAFTVPVVDTTGAGDVFHGAFIFGLLQQWALPDILRFASAVAALKCTALGGRAGIPNRPQTEQFLDRHLNCRVTVL